MNKLLAAVVASTIALGCASAFAAAAKQELTQEERIEMRNRAAQLKAAGTATPAPVKAAAQPATKTKKHDVKKSKKTSKHDAKKSRAKV